MEFASATCEVNPLGVEALCEHLDMEVDEVRRHLAVQLYIRNEDRLGDQIAELLQDRRALGIEQLAIARERLCVVFSKMRGTPHGALLGHVPGDLYQWALQVADDPQLSRGVDRSRTLALSSIFRMLHTAAHTLHPQLDSEAVVWATKGSNTLKTLIQKAKAMPHQAPHGRPVQLNQ